MPELGFIFDWDGVIVDSSFLHEKSWEALAQEIDRPLPQNHFKQGFGKRNEIIIPKILKWSKDGQQVKLWGKRKEELYRKFAKEAGIKFKVVPFGSGAQMVQALMAGKIDATLPNVSEAANQVADGSFRALAVMAEERLKDYPNVPSTFEKGIKAKCSTTRGYAVLASTPQPIIDQISKAMVKAMKHDVFASYLAGAGLTVESSVAGTKIWDKHLKAEYKVAASALKELGLVK